MANTTFSGPVISKNGFIGFGPGMSVNINSTGLGAQGLNLTVNDHAGRLLISQDADGIYTLPSINTNANGRCRGVWSRSRRLLISTHRGAHDGMRRVAWRAGAARSERSRGCVYDVG